MDKAKQSAAGSAVATGLRGVVAASSSIGDVNGEKGELIYQGVNIHDLATKSTFEEVVFLLWNGRLPTGAELDELKASLSASYKLPADIIELIKGISKRVPAKADPMDRLRTVVSALAMFDEEANDLSREASIRVATWLTAQFPRSSRPSIAHATISNRLNQNPTLNIASNFLYMAEGECRTSLELTFWTSL